MKTKCDVLIVEDDPDIVALVERALGAVGHNSVVADDVWTGIELARQIPYDLIITDYQLGAETAQTLVNAIRQDNVDVPILLMSAKMEKADFGSMIREAVDDYVSKPLDLSELFGAVNRLILLGDQREKAKKRASKLLEVSARVKIGVEAEGTLQMLVDTVADITPFQVAVLDLIDEDAPRLRREAVRGTQAMQGPTLDQVQGLYRSGLRFDIASFVPGDRNELIANEGLDYHQTTARERPWKPEDQVFVEIKTGGTLWGYFRVSDPVDEMRPSEDTMRMLALLGHNLANTLENRRAYRRQQRLSSQLRIVSEMVRTALSRPDLGLVKKMLSEVAVNRFDASFSCFVERIEGRWRVDTISCGQISEYANVIEFSSESTEILESIERERTERHLRRSHGDWSLVGRQSMRSSLVIPIFTRDTLRHIFMIENDRRPEFPEDDILAFTTLADQIGLIWSSVLHQKYLEQTAVELQESYQKLKEANDLNVRLQSMLKSYIPASTWESVLQSSGEDEEQGPIEAMVECAVMFIDVVGFTKISESASPSQIMGLLNAYFTMMARIVSQSSGEVIKYIGDGIMAFFNRKDMAVRASDDIIKSQARLNRSIESLEIGSVALRVGVAWGPAILCRVGPFFHQDRTLLGDTVNTASRLEHLAKPGTALLDAALVPEGDKLEDYELVRIDSVIVRGKMKPVPVMTFSRDEPLYRA